MGYYISFSRIESISRDYSFYFFLLGNRDRKTGVGPSLYDRFDEIASSLYAHAAIIKTYESRVFYRELVPYLYNSDNRDALNSFSDDNKPCLLILNQHPMHFDENTGYFLLLSFDVLDKLYNTSNDLVDDILKLGIYGIDNISLRLAHLHNQPNSGFFGRIYNSLLLQPNFSGLGFDLKVLFEKSQKDNNDKSDYVFIDNRRKRKR